MVDKQKYKEFIRNIELEGIYLSKLSCNNHGYENHSKNKGTKELNAEVGASFSVKKSLEEYLYTSSFFQIEVFTGEDNEDKEFEIDLELVAIYKYNVNLIDDEITERFVNSSVPLNTWPYARETVSSMCTKMGYPPLFMKTFTLSK
ncbi:MAG: protein-export chaperone SecB [Clostridiales bacterium]|nr:protein-export chaperone SecB [Clostridiales bacterium]MCF8022656.1 protein-export chaperone SecB [Clostridiales bacterium]